MYTLFAWLNQKVALTLLILNKNYFTSETDYHNHIGL